VRKQNLVNKNSKTPFFGSMADFMYPTNTVFKQMGCSLVGSNFSRQLHGSAPIGKKLDKKCQ